jgi:hypothetical protein
VCWLRGGAALRIDVHGRPLAAQQATLMLLWQKLYVLGVWPLSVLLALLRTGSAAPPQPRLRLLESSQLAIEAQADSSGVSFEGGTLLRTDDSSLHLFTTDTSRGLNTSLVYYRANPHSNQFSFVRQLICCSTGRPDGLPRASLWAPMPAYDEQLGSWRLYYVSYRSVEPANASGWFTNASGWWFNYDGRVEGAVSTVPGKAGIGGPYNDTGVVLQPDAGTQPWEGLQGTDSLSPPFLLLDNRTFAVFYGSAQTQRAGVSPHHLLWYNGLATASSLGGPWVRRKPSALVDFNGGFSENPIVSWLSPVAVRRAGGGSHGLYIAVFDDLNQQSRGFGLSWSDDGLDWARPAAIVNVSGGARTPLAAMAEDDGTVSVYYTAYVPAGTASCHPRGAADDDDVASSTVPAPCERVFHGRFELTFEAPTTMTALPGVVTAACPNPHDCTDSLLQALTTEGASLVIVPDTGRPWMVRPLAISNEASSNRTIQFEAGVELLAMDAPSFHWPLGGALLTITNASNITLRGGTIRMRRSDYADISKYNHSEYRHGLSLYGCEAVTIDSMIIMETGANIVTNFLLYVQRFFVHAFICWCG